MLLRHDNKQKIMLMKKKNEFLVLLVGFLVLSISAVAKDNPAKSKGLEMPENIKAIIDNKCFGCHNTESKNDKAKEDLNFSTFDELSLMKKVSSYNKIAEELEERKMPPEKFLEHFPDKDVTNEERAALMEWAKKEAEALVKGN